MAKAGHSNRDEILHASSVAVGNHAALILGRSGSGKSALSLGLIARGARLVADDRTRVYRQEERLFAESPVPIRGLIEARGVGLLAAPTSGPSPVSVVIDLDHVATERLPPARRVTILSISVPLLYKVESSHFIDAVLLYLRGGRSTE